MSGQPFDESVIKEKCCRDYLLSCLLSISLTEFQFEIELKSLLYNLLVRCAPSMHCDCRY